MINDFFTQNLAFLRDQMEVSQSEMAESIGFKRTTWSGYENGKSKPNYSDLLKIAEYFGISLSDLIERDLGNSNLTEYKKDAKKQQKSNLTSNPIGNLTAVNEDFQGYNSGVHGQKQEVPLTEVLTALLEDRKMLLDMAKSATDAVRQANELMVSLRGVLNPEEEIPSTPEQLLAAHMKGVKEKEDQELQERVAKARKALEEKAKS